MMIMKKLMIVLALCVTFASSAQEKIVLRLMGDSTMADKDLSYENPERGWGQRLKSHVDTNVVVANYAQNGRSTKSVQTLGIWDNVKKDLKAGEYLFIQFGINDAASNKAERYAPVCGNVDNPTEGSYEWYMTQFINDAKAKGATPILVTTVIGILLPLFTSRPMLTKISPGNPTKAMPPSCS